MPSYEPTIVMINNLENARDEIKKIGCDPKSIDIMAPKAISRAIKVRNVVLQDAIIIKQDMLSIGGEVAIPKDAFKLENKEANILIIGTLKQLSDLVEKLDRHYTRIKKISEELSFLIEKIK